MTTFDPDALTRRLAELEETMGTPGFWDDQARAASVSTEHARATRKLERYESLRREVDEAAELLELEPELEAEVAEQVAPVREELARLQEEALFDGEYDAGDAVVTITAAPAAPTPRTGRRCCSACTSAGRPPGVSRPRSSRRARARRRASSPRR